MRNLKPNGLTASALVHVVWASTLIAWCQLSAIKPSCTEPGWGLVWQKSLSPCSPRQSCAILLDSTGHETPESYLVDISRDCFGNRQLFSLSFSCTHARRRETPPLVSGIAGRCLGSRLTWLEVSSGTKQQEKNEAERCRNFFHSILCSLFWAIRRGKACVNGWWEDLSQFFEGPSG